MCNSLIFLCFYTNSPGAFADPVHIGFLAIPPSLPGRRPRFLCDPVRSCANAPFPAFRDAESYYATLSHEITHWTRHPSHLDRDSGRKQWGDEGYAKEELVAELGSAFLCVELGITPETREDHAAYIASWLKALQDDKRCIFSAAAHAQRAVDFLTCSQPQEESGMVAA